MPQMNRDLAARLGLETVEIIREGAYTAPSGQRVDLSRALESCRSGTIEYPPDHDVPQPRAAAADTIISVENATTLEMGRRLAARDERTAALNFASATHPGGGFLGGARAQEESLARSSGLYAALDGREMYAPHRRSADARYTDWVIYSPDVPVFRNDAGELLEEPWTMAIVTCAAVNGYALAEHAPERMREIPAVMQKRTARVLAVAAEHRVRRLVLGAWGCGAFGLDAPMMAGIFKEALFGPFKGVFEEIVFAITDWSPAQRTIEPFRRAFEP